MTLQPYHSADGLHFNANPDQVQALLGRPQAIASNDIGLTEWDYGERVVRFNQANEVVEITVAARSIDLGTVSIPLCHLASHVRQYDAAAFTWARFLVSPALGLAFDPEQAPWVTCFARAELPQWQAGGLQEQQALEAGPR